MCLTIDGSARGTGRPTDSLESPRKSGSRLAFHRLVVDIPVLFRSFISGPPALAARARIPQRGSEEREVDAVEVEAEGVTGTERRGRAAKPATVDRAEAERIGGEMAAILERAAQEVTR